MLSQSMIRVSPGKSFFLLFVFSVLVLAFPLSAHATITPQKPTGLVDGGKKHICDKFKEIQPIVKTLGGDNAPKPVSLDGKYNTPKAQISTMNLTGMFGDFVQNGFAQNISSVLSLAGGLGGMLSGFSNAGGWTGNRPPEQSTGDTCPTPQKNSPESGQKTAFDFRVNPPK